MTEQVGVQVPVPSGVRCWEVIEATGRSGALVAEGPRVPRDPISGERRTRVISLDDLPALLDHFKERLLSEKAVDAAHAVFRGTAAIHLSHAGVEKLLNAALAAAFTQQDIEGGEQ